MLRTNPFEGSGGVLVDVVREDGAVVVTADVPGFEKEDFDLTVSEGTLAIAAERETAADVDEDTYVRRERSTQSVRRSVDLSAAVAGHSPIARGLCPSLPEAIHASPSTRTAPVRHTRTASAP